MLTTTSPDSIRKAVVGGSPSLNNTSPALSWIRNALNSVSSWLDRCSKNTQGRSRGPVHRSTLAISVSHLGQLRVLAHLHRRDVAMSDLQYPRRDEHQQL